MTANIAFDLMYTFDAVLYGIGWWKDGREAPRPSGVEMEPTSDSMHQKLKQDDQAPQQDDDFL